jgi:CheY-like chemotaxis protein
MAVELLVKALQGSGFDARSAMDLATLDQRLAETRYDLILVDVNMPEMYGDDVIEFLRVQRNIDSKLILHSDISAEELAQRAKSSGASGFIPKSLGLEATLSEIAKLTGFAPAATSGSPEAQPAPATKKVEEGQRRKRVLIVDDSEVATKLLQSELADKGFDVSTADTAEKATKIILKKQTRPDLVLLDVRMPNVNGEQFCRFIKSNSLFSGIKVLLCSSEDPEELQRICREAGADGFLPKDAILTKVLNGLT